jgi:hypothetical protein
MQRLRPSRFGCNGKIRAGMDGQKNGFAVQLAESSDATRESRITQLVMAAGVVYRS